MPHNDIKTGILRRKRPYISGEQSPSSPAKKVRFNINADTDRSEIVTAFKKEQIERRAFRRRMKQIRNAIQAGHQNMSNKKDSFIAHELAKIGLTLDSESNTAKFKSEMQSFFASKYSEKTLRGMRFFMPVEFDFFCKQVVPRKVLAAYLEQNSYDLLKKIINGIRSLQRREEEVLIYREKHLERKQHQLDTLLSLCPNEVRNFMDNSDITSPHSQWTLSNQACLFALPKTQSLVST